MLERVAIPSPGDLPNPGIEPGSPALQADSLPSESPAPGPHLTSLKSKSQKDQFALVLLSFNLESKFYLDSRSKKSQTQKQRWKVVEGSE